jgi:hypothetical protein
MIIRLGESNYGKKPYRGSYGHKRRGYAPPYGKSGYGNRDYYNDKQAYYPVYAGDYNNKYFDNHGYQQFYVPPNFEHSIRELIYDLGTFY